MHTPYPPEVSRQGDSLRRSTAVPLVIAMVLLASCGGSEGVATSSPSTTSTTSTTTTGPTTTIATTTTSIAQSTTTAAAVGCTSGSTTIPNGAASEQVVDVDGDGTPDTAWTLTEPSGVTKVGVVTAAGGGTERTWDSASPVMRSFLVVLINDATPPLFLADDGRTVQLWAFNDCEIADVTNVQGENYTFSMGFTDFGTGVGCATIDGTNQLLGLNVVGDDAGTVDWTSTVVTVTGTEARNGAITNGTFTSPADDEAIALLRTVACGELTIAEDGISAPQ